MHVTLRDALTGLVLAAGAVAAQAQAYPISRCSGENSSVIHVPAMMMEQLRRAMNATRR